MTVAAWSTWRARADWVGHVALSCDDEAGSPAGLIENGGIPGQCSLCDRDAVFGCGESSPSPREGMLCQYCRCNGRQRAAAAVLLDALPHASAARVYATEQASGFYLALRRRVGRLVGSEYGIAFAQRWQLSKWLWRHGARCWVRREDVTALRMRDASLDAVVSLDVLEHVPDHQAALRQFARVLKPGGTLVLTVPFYYDNAASTQIACIDATGAVAFFGEPEFHGDPLRGGVACFHHFGWDLLASMRAAGFSDAAACRVRAPELGLPKDVWVLRARR